MGSRPHRRLCEHMFDMEVCVSGQGVVDASARGSRDRQLESLRTRIEAMSPRSTSVAARSVGGRAGAADDVLVSDCLAAVLPDGGLRRDTIVGCPRGSVLLALLAGATAAGNWSAVVGNPQLYLPCTKWVVGWTGWRTSQTPVQTRWPLSRCCWTGSTSSSSITRDTRPPPDPGDGGASPKSVRSVDHHRVGLA